MVKEDRLFLKKILSFVHLAEKLKIEHRNGHTSEDTNESVADHCWRVGLMVILLSPYLDKKIGLEKTIKMALIHDLAEIITGDSPYFLYEGNQVMAQEKHEKEYAAMKSLIGELPADVGKEIIDLWSEFEEQSSYEARFVLALDKMEAQIQHNEAPIHNWNDYDLEYADTLLDKYCDFDNFLSTFKKLVQEESLNKIAADISR
ncbi:HD domain-containing protein [Candidatus Neptunochlamydia vexilliferae]|nr:HD domain-containing protein [Candidatus Neptunochlamydia vexilliferae]